MGLLANIVQDNKFTSSDIPPFEEKLFFEGAKHRAHLERFAVLLFLSAVIATYGVLGDSTATVIGAMIIAPLMIPIMGTAAGLVMGDMKRAVQAIIVVILGIAGTIGTAWFIAMFLNTTVISFTSNSQIVSRVSPNLTDLCVALACGAAGAFAMSRSDVADSLPGVAISISLVPPLSVVGIALSQAQWNDAWGAMLLFLTNFLSILLAGGGTLALLGLSAASTKQLDLTARRKAFLYIFIGVVIVTIPLGITSFQVAQESKEEVEAQQFTQQWLDQSDYEVSDIDAQGNQIVIVITGSGPLPPLPDSSSDLRKMLGPNGQLELNVVPSLVLFYPDPDSADTE